MTNDPTRQAAITTGLIEIIAGAEALWRLAQSYLFWQRPPLLEPPMNQRKRRVWRLPKGDLMPVWRIKCLSLMITLVRPIQSLQQLLLRAVTASMKPSLYRSKGKTTGTSNRTDQLPMTRQSSELRRPYCTTVPGSKS